MRSRYDVMKESTTLFDVDGNAYYDPLTFPARKFKATKSVLEYFLTENDIKREDLLMFRAYGVAELDDIIQILNGIAILDDVEPGERILLPDRVDLENFLVDNNTG